MTWYLKGIKDDGTFTYTDCMDEKDFLKRARSLLVVRASLPETKPYELFTNQVLNYTGNEPFNFRTPPVFSTHSYVKASIYFILINFSVFSL